jgi:phospholipid/cholesterol/gamma-HCH transport system permease protein
MTKITQNFMKFDPQQKLLDCLGDWNVANIVTLQKQLKELLMPVQGALTIDGSGITAFDSAGAWLLSQWFAENGFKGTLKNFSKAHKQLLEMVSVNNLASQKLVKKHIHHPVNRLGQLVEAQMFEFFTFLSFIGELAIEMVGVIKHPQRFRWKALASCIFKTGLQALPIIALLSFMIGVVIAYQMGNQLRNYGANVLIVDFLGLAVLREFGPLITAIMVAGRTGSAYTAELGIMKINQEIDALDTMGVTPGELLLIPRVLGLFITLPLLAMWADVFGIMGGMLMAKTTLDIPLHDFLLRFQAEIPLRALLIGLGKAPVFALLIATIGCFEGMKVEMNSDSLGKKTTRSVVMSIFFIIVADAVFSIIFSRLNL